MGERGGDESQQEKEAKGYWEGSTLMLLHGVSLIRLNESGILNSLVASQARRRD